jgi:protein TonB
MSSVKTSNPNSFEVKMFNLSPSKQNRIESEASAVQKSQAENSAVNDPRQRRLMLGSLCLLLVTLSIVLWHDRDFWFPDSPDTDAETDQPVEIAPVAKATSIAASTAPSTVVPTDVAKHKTALARAIVAPKLTAPTQPPASTAPNGTVVVASRTVLPPLQVEVVAGDSHRVVHPGSNSVRVDLQPGILPQPAPEVTSIANDQNAENMIANVAERVQISADTSAMVASPVKPSYPLLARQMKVQGAVVLQALIGRDGAIQNLRLLSGPRILASAAEDAVRQWHFKPHYDGQEAVETQANITVNFTISTN